MAIRQVKQPVMQSSSHHNPAKARPLGLGPIMINLVACWPCNFGRKLLHSPLRRREHACPVCWKNAEKKCASTSTKSCVGVKSL